MSLTFAIVLAVTNTVGQVCSNDYSSARYAFGPQLDNLEFGVPAADVVLDRVGFATGYSYSKRQPLWVEYRLTAEEVTNRVVARSHEMFTSDTSLGTSTPCPEDYLRSGYDRGHIAPAADMAWSKESMSNSFFMSNMSPQRPMFNRGIWADLEKWVRTEAVRNGSLIVYSGPVFTCEPGCTNNFVNGIEVPAAYYKVILSESQPSTMIGFILKNEGSREPLIAFVRTVDEVEALTGLDFFSSLPDDIEEQLESVVITNRWNLTR